MPEFTLSRSQWKKFKEDNNLSKSSFFKKADVGPHIDSFHKAAAQFLRLPGKKSTEACIKKCEDLCKAFEKFIGLKEAKAELATDAKAKIKKWQAEVNQHLKDLRELHKENKADLENWDVGHMNKTFTELGM